MTWLLRINYLLFVYHFLVLLYLLLFRIDCTALVLLVCFVFSLPVFSFFEFRRWAVLVFWYFLCRLVYFGILCVGWYILYGLVMFCFLLVCMVRGLVSR